MKCPNCGSTELQKNGSKRGVQRYICKSCGRYFQEGSAAPKRQLTKNKKMAGISIEQFRKNYDIVFILSQIPEKFEEGVLYEKSDIITMAGLSPGFPGIPTVLESEEWKKYQGRAGQKTWYGQPGLISKLKGEGIMR